MSAETVVVSERRERSLHVHIPDYDGPLDGLFHLVARGQVPLERLPLASLTEQLMAGLARLDSVDLAPMFEEWVLPTCDLVHDKTTHLRKLAERLLREIAPRVLELANRGGVLLLLEDDGEEDVRAQLRALRLEHARTLVRALARLAQDHDVERFGYEAIKEVEDAAQAPGPVVDRIDSGDAPKVGGGAGEGTSQEEDLQELLGEVVGLACTVPSIDWHREEDVQIEIARHVREHGPTYLDAFFAEDRRRNVTVFQAMLALCRRGRTPLELARGGGVLLLENLPKTDGFIARQVKDGRILVGNTWDILPPHHGPPRCPPPLLVRDASEPAHRARQEQLFDQLDNLFARLKECLGGLVMTKEATHRMLRQVLLQDYVGVGVLPELHEDGDPDLAESIRARLLRRLVVSGQQETAAALALREINSSWWISRGRCSPTELLETG